MIRKNACTHKSCGKLETFGAGGGGGGGGGGWGGEGVSSVCLLSENESNVFTSKWSILKFHCVFK